MNASLIDRYRHNGFLLFMLLVAFAMVQMASFYVLLPLIFFAIITYILPEALYPAGYLTVALTVCKNE